MDQQERDEMRGFRREGTRWWIWGLGLLIVSGVVFTLLSYVGVFTRTVVEREVFENSYQYQAGKVEQVATYKAQLAALQAQLEDSTLTESTRANLNAQVAAIKIQLAAVEGR